MSKTHELFVAAFDAITTTVDYSQDWENGTGYLDFAVKAKFDHPVGTVLKCMSSDDRRIIIIVMGGVFGNVVLFERYSHGARGAVVFNMVTPIYQLFGLNNELNESQLRLMIGDVYHINVPEWSSNVAMRMGSFATRVAAMEARLDKEAVDEVDA